MKNRTRAYYRAMRYKAICHKRYIDRQILHNAEHPYYEHDGQYSKNKIHCSCTLCKYSKVYNLPTRKDKLADIIEKQQLAEVI